MNVSEKLRAWWRRKRAERRRLEGYCFAVDMFDKYGEQAEGSLRTYYDYRDPDFARGVNEVLEAWASFQATKGEMHEIG